MRTNNQNDRIHLRSFSTIIGITVLFFGFINCRGTKDQKNSYELESNPSFNVTAAFFQNWIAGVKEGGSGTHVSIELDSSEEIEIREIYFHNQSIKAQKSAENNSQYIGYFVDMKKGDMIMDRDSIKEAHNIPPMIIPFKLKDNEAVFSYFEKGEKKYFRLTNLDEKPPIAYPADNPNKEN